MPFTLGATMGDTFMYEKPSLSEYLCSKYEVKKPTTITAIEAKLFGIQYPPKKDWVTHYGRLWLTEKGVNHLLEIANEKMKSGSSARKQWQKAAEYLEFSKRGISKAKSTLDDKLFAMQAALKNSTVDPNSTGFLETFEWRAIRMVALKKYKSVCQCCGASKKTGAVIHVDHIKPRSLFPELALDIENLQVLCDACNHGKGSWDTTDWRENNQLLNL